MSDEIKIIPPAEIQADANPFDELLGGMDSEGHPRNVLARLTDETVPGYRDPTSGMVIRLVRMTIDQHDITMQAVKAVRKVTGYGDMSQGRALELICADFMTGPMIIEGEP